MNRIAVITAGSLIVGCAIAGAVCTPLLYWKATHLTSELQAANEALEQANNELDAAEGGDRTPSPSDTSDGNKKSKLAGNRPPKKAVAKKDVEPKGDDKKQQVAQKKANDQDDKQDVEKKEAPHSASKPGSVAEKASSKKSDVSKPADSKPANSKPVNSKPVNSNVADSESAEPKSSAKESDPTKVADAKASGPVLKGPANDSSEPNDTSKANSVVVAKPPIKAAGKKDAKEARVTQLDSGGWRTVRRTAKPLTSTTLDPQTLRNRPTVRYPNGVIEVKE